jgi:leucine-rich repeat protein SHOC2
LKSTLKYLLLFLIPGTLFAQKEFEKYGPMGSKVYVDLKEALKVEAGVYKMDLSYKKLDPKDYARLSKLKDLQVLKLSGNEVTEFPKNIGDMFNLVYFCSINNYFTGFPSDFKKLQNLYHLELSFTNIDSIPAEIAYLRKLKTFKFTDTDDTLKLPTTLKYLKGLQDIQIENCIMDSFPKQIFKVASLKFLYLSKTNTYALPSNFDKLPNLEVMIIENNPISSIPNNIYQARNLRLISLRNTKIKKLPDTISQMENLALLDLRGTEVSKGEIEVLKALLPGCEVKYDLQKDQSK